MSGDVAGARGQFEEVVRASPPDTIDEPAAKAHYSLALLSSSSGGTAEAIDHLSAAVKYQPNYVEAQLALADAQRRGGRVEASPASYRETLRINLRAPQARLGYAIALAQLRRYRDALDWLTDAAAQSPDRPEFAHAIARLRATAPDDRVRDGRQALAIVQALLQNQQKTTDLGETMAMALAEIGDFDQRRRLSAASWRRPVRRGSPWPWPSTG